MVFTYFWSTMNNGNCANVLFRVNWIPNSVSKLICFIDLCWSIHLNTEKVLNCYNQNNSENCRELSDSGQ